jgi:hypothetical protein
VGHYHEGAASEGEKPADELIGAGEEPASPAPGPTPGDPDVVSLDDEAVRELFNDGEDEGDT